MYAAVVERIRITDQKRYLGRDRKRLGDLGLHGVFLRHGRSHDKTSQENRNS